MNAGIANIHGVAVAVGEIGLLILGDSGAGKSALAARMIATWPFGRVRLVADDRVMLSVSGNAVIARSHPAIAGDLELRGVGIVQPASLEAVVVRGVLRLSPNQEDRLPACDMQREAVLGQALPKAVLPVSQAAYARLITVWPYFSGQLFLRR
jgi:HPr kinase/phosphorylase